MGEKEPEKKEAEKSTGAGDGPTTVVLKVDLHCEGCAQKVQRTLKHINGVETVKADYTSNKVTVVGKVDPIVVKEKVEEKIKKKVVLVSPQPPKKDQDAPAAAAAPTPADAKKPEEKAPEKKPDEPKKAEEKKPKEPPPVVTVVLKTRVHCDGCAHKMKKIIMKYEGVEDVSVDLSKDQITVKGTMGMKAMLPYLNAKLKRPVDIIPPPDLATTGLRNTGSSELHIQVEEKSNLIDIDVEVSSPDPVIPQPKSKLSECPMTLVILGAVNASSVNILVKELQGQGTALMPNYCSRTILGLLTLSLSCLVCVEVFYEKLPTKFANIATYLAFGCNAIAFFTLVTFYMAVV